MKIILLHGLYMHGIALIPLRNRLQEAGHDVLNLSYNTVFPDLDTLFAEMDAFIDAQPTAIVAHSMGGVITRVYLEAGSEMSRFVEPVITLGTPHQGSEVAAFFRKIGLGELMFQDSCKFLLPENEPSWPDNVTLYSLAGDMAIGPARVLVNNGEPSDGTVLIVETKITGMASHEVFPLTHTGMILSRRIADRIIEILG
ncbi:lipase/acyltransferase domain-containing protein [Enterovibrio paralichthyis]|uniref:PGAP1-like alpha/beta domain-containing protein n=1 Tax=Enterovibrio paralichthyis TaxID=2853805 RepID=UPI001C495530|nr:cob(I)alamin adenolsyltransferase [Enterovibrio paralichthyis]MBV7299406.1 cob(I)alamin adenolsyltransferase [Enterovibrio paralichthyis]